MDAQRRAEITGWDAQEFSDGFSELRRLADRGFSGAVTNGTGWLFVFEGRVVGTAGADLDAFADASGTIYQAPADVLPVLFAMQERGGEPRAQYYTNDTPLSEADRKLSQGGFTGYIELSENVLSGDYYVTYTAGESMAAAYVGNSRRLETDDDAFALADDEVGIYTVYEVDLDVREIPDAGAAGGVASADESDTEDTPEDASADDPAEPDPVKPDSPADGPAADPSGDPDDFGARDEGGDANLDADTDEERAEEPATDRRRDDEPTTDRRRDDRSANGRRDDPTGAEAAAEMSTEPEQSESRAATATDERDDRDERNASRSSGAERSSAAASASGRDESDSDRDRPSDDVFSEEEQWREQKSIPALDPSEASDPPGQRRRSEADSASESRSSAGSTESRRSGSRGRSDDPDAAAESPSPEPRSTERSRENRSAVSQRSAGAGQTARENERVDERVERLQAELNAAEQKRESLKAERDELAASRDELANEVDRLQSELSTLREERDQLQSELSSARDRLPESDRSISAAEARSGTNLFVRYESKGGATLEDAHDGAVGRDELRENLRIEHHTSFETDGLVVEGRPYEEFLTETIEYGFTRWLVEELPFEVSGTGNEGVLKALYDAIPEVDRAEIGGSVSIALRENGEETREQRSFDLVLRDRMGNPLFVADLNDSRDPTPEGTLESLVGNGRDIAESNDPFAATFAVTESFFEPGALETASDAVGGGLFSRSKRASFVKLSRKRGFHLCLVEARDGGFHMTVPDL
ncbi:hypothetical protein [Halorubrum halophilum]|uniref:cell division protein ZapB n=1 Tax=Halorubrum halophilum TaxID=413816 RepID=UPI00186B5067|nr:hypothetical protein [Halorubrum halophilum]